MKRRASRLWAELAGEARILGPQDLWLAAACMAHGLALVTARGLANPCAVLRLEAPAAPQPAVRPAV